MLIRAVIESLTGETVGVSSVCSNRRVAGASYPHLSRSLCSFAGAVPPAISGLTGSAAYKLDVRTVPVSRAGLARDDPWFIRQCARHLDVVYACGASACLPGLHAGCLDLHGRVMMRPSLDRCRSSRFPENLPKSIDGLIDHRCFCR